MSFVAPIWFVALVPWAAITLYLLWGRRRAVNVPFLDLWPASESGVRIRRRATPPTWALLFAILSMLLAIFAAARPVMVSATSRPIALIVDRGWTVSSTLLIDLPEDFPKSLNVWTVPKSDPEPFHVSDGKLEKFFRSTALATREAVHASIRARLSQDDRPVIVFSNQKLDILDPRLIQIAPKALSTSRIVSLSARETPTPQVMIRLTGKSGRLRVSSGDAVVERDVTLAPGAEHDEFVDLAQLGSSIKAEFIVEGVVSPTCVAWLARESRWPRIESRVALHPSLDRMVEIYSKQRPAGKESSRVSIVDSTGDLPSSERGVIVPKDVSKLALAGALQVADHPVLRNVDWSEIGSPDISNDLPPAGFTSIVSSGGQTWVAVRNEPARAVWIGFDSADWSRSTSFVVFWANVFNWVGAAGEQFTAHPAGSLEGKWTPVEIAPSTMPPEPMLWPGLYLREDGGLRAVRPAESVPPIVIESDWQSRLATLRKQSHVELEFAPALVLLSLACLTGCAGTWKRSNSGKFHQT